MTMPKPIESSESKRKRIRASQLEWGAPTNTVNYADEYEAQFSRDEMARIMSSAIEQNDTDMSGLRNWVKRSTEETIVKEVHKLECTVYDLKAENDRLTKQLKKQTHLADINAERALSCDSAWEKAATAKADLEDYREDDRERRSEHLRAFTTLLTNVRINAVIDARAEAGMTTRIIFTEEKAANWTEAFTSEIKALNDNSKAGVIMLGKPATLITASLGNVRKAKTNMIGGESFKITSVVVAVTGELEFYLQPLSSEPFDFALVKEVDVIDLFGKQTFNRVRKEILKEAFFHTREELESAAAMKENLERFAAKKNDGDADSVVGAW